MRALQVRLNRGSTSCTARRGAAAAWARHAIGLATPGRGDQLSTGRVNIRSETRARKSRIFFPQACTLITFPHWGARLLSSGCAVRLDALKTEIGVEYTDLPERIDRDVLEEMGEQIATSALAKQPTAPDGGLFGGDPWGVEGGAVGADRPIPAAGEEAGPGQYHVGLERLV